MEQVSNQMAPLGFHLPGEILLGGLMQQLLGACQRLGRHRGQPLGKQQSCGQRVPPVCDRLNEASCVQLASAHWLGQPYPLLHQWPRQRAGQLPCGTAVRREALACLGEGEARILGRHDQIASQRKREARIRGGAFDRRNDRLGNRAQDLDELVQRVEHVPLGGGAFTAPRVQRRQVLPCAEMRAIAAKDDCPYRAIISRDVERFDPGCQQLFGQRVACDWIADREHQDASMALGLQFGGHRRIAGARGPRIVSRGLSAPPAWARCFHAAHM